MTTLIRLDASAMNALFPEGHEARIELMHAVLSESVNRFVKVQITKDLESLFSALKDKIKGEYDFEGVVKDHVYRMFSGYTLNKDSPLHMAISDVVKKAVGEQVETLIETSVKAAVESKCSLIDSAVSSKVNAEFRNRIDAEVKERVAKVTKGLNEALKANS